MRLENFRNLEKCDLEPCPGVNIIYGDNAQGKTNLMEGIWMLTGARSFRGAKDAELTRFGEPGARLEAWFWKDGREQTAMLALGEKKIAELNEIPLRSATGLAGVFCAVVFSPAHLSLVQDGPSARRRFVDSCICQLSPQYMALLTDYRRTLLQRNSLLKDITYSSFLLDTLDIWDERLAALAALVYAQRARYLERISGLAGQFYRGIASGKEVLAVRYEAGPPPELSKEAVRLWYVQALRTQRTEDLRMGSTSVGPHRDDLLMLVNGANLRVYGSQGQQRSGVLAFKLAEAALLKELTHDEPVVLLDDVMSELDEKRKEYLLNHLGENQVFITCCDPAYFAKLQGGRTFQIKNGALATVQDAQKTT